jgi:[ribosomal protein S5]-alanine N-acetyltransferase
MGRTFFIRLNMKLDIHLPDLSTPRLRFRELTMNDAGAYKEFFDDAEAMRFYNITPGDPGSAATWIGRQLKRYEDFGTGLWALIDKTTGQPVGQCGLLVQEVDGLQELEIGYNLIPRHWGKGYATEAAQACKLYAFERRLAASIISIIHVDNVNSQRVAERNGMTREKQTTFREWPVYVYRIPAPAAGQ